MTTMSTCSLLVVAVATTVVCAFAPSAVVCALAPSPATAGPNSSPCPWRTVPHPEVEDTFIQKLGKWAVDQQHTVMKFEKVESAKYQGVGQPCISWFFHNCYYELIIDAAIRGDPGTAAPSPGDDVEKYRAVVYVVNFSQPQKVISFSHDSPAAN